MSNPYSGRELFYGHVALRIDHIASILGLEEEQIPDVYDDEETVFWAMDLGLSTDWLYWGDPSRYQYRVVRSRAQ